MGPDRYKIGLTNRLTGQTKDIEFVVNWDPDKVGLDEIKNACAARYTVEDKLHHQNNNWIPVSIQLITEEDLAEELNEYERTA